MIDLKYELMDTEELLDLYDKKGISRKIFISVMKQKYGNAFDEGASYGYESGISHIKPRI